MLKPIKGSGGLYPQQIKYKACEICVGMEGDHSACVDCIQKYGKTYWENAFSPLCRFTGCAHGMGLVSGGGCPGESWNTECPAFEGQEDLQDMVESRHRGPLCRCGDVLAMLAVKNRNGVDAQEVYYCLDCDQHYVLRCLPKRHVKRLVAAAKASPRVWTLGEIREHFMAILHANGGHNDNGGS